jgi:anti-sigma-K factor RskA
LTVQEYIASGILESYVLGVTTPQETLEVERMAQEHPLIEDEIHQLHKSLEQFIFMGEVSPPADLRNRILDALPGMAGVPAEEDSSQVPLGKEMPLFRPYLMAAAYILLALSLPANLFLYLALQNTQQKVVQLEQESQSLVYNLKMSQRQFTALQEDVNMLQNPDTKAIMLFGMEKSPKAWAKLYWNKPMKTVYLASHDLPPAPKGMQYQLWAIKDGRPLDAGMLSDEDGLLKLKEISEAEAFAITLEKKGGVPLPEGEMYVMGKI